MQRYKYKIRVYTRVVEYRGTSMNRIFENLNLKIYIRYNREELADIKHFVTKLELE